MLLTSHFDVFVIFLNIIVSQSDAHFLSASCMIIGMFCILELGCMYEMDMTL